MPDQLDIIIQKMIDAGETEEDIGAVIQDYNRTYPVKDAIPKQEMAGPPSPPKPYTGPSTFGQGFKQSLTSGEALKSGLQGGLGFLKGAVLDIPSFIGGQLKNIANMYANPQQAGQETWEGIKSMPGQIANTTMQAGSDPESFGRMVGGYTGQPAIMAGLGPKIPGAIPPTIRGLGKPVEAMGRLAKREGFASGFLPPFTTPRYLKVGEKAIGRGVEALGKKMQTVGLKPGPLKSTAEEVTIKSSYMDDNLIDWLRQRGFSFSNMGRDGNVTFKKVSGRP